MRSLPPVHGCVNGIREFVLTLGAGVEVGVGEALGVALGAGVGAVEVSGVGVEVLLAVNDSVVEETGTTFAQTPPDAVEIPLR